MTNSRKENGRAKVWDQRARSDGDLKLWFSIVAFISSTSVKSSNVKLAIIALILFNALIFDCLTIVILIMQTIENHLVNNNINQRFDQNFDQLILTLFSTNWFGELIFDLLSLNSSICCQYYCVNLIFLHRTFFINNTNRQISGLIGPMVNSTFFTDARRNTSDGLFYFDVSVLFRSPTFLPITEGTFSLLKFANLGNEQHNKK